MFWIQVWDRLKQGIRQMGFLSSSPFFLPDDENRIQLSKRRDFMIL
jgi:hypothetical protein